MKPFFRFLRPVRFCYRRHCVEATPNGGICFYVTPVEIADDRIIDVSFFIYPCDAVFSRTGAKKRAMLHPSRRITVAKLTADNIADSYLQFHRSIREVGDLKQMLDKIRLSKQRAELQAKLHKDAIEALKLRQRYHDLTA